MRPWIVAAASGIVAFGAAGTASAQEKCFDKGTLSYVDCPQPPPPPAPLPVAPEPKPSWTGWYLGAHAGYGQGDVDAVYSGNTVAGVTELEPNGFLVGGQFAGLYQFDNNVVLGVEIDGSAAFFDDDEFKTFGPANSEFHEAEIDYLASARVKLGYAIDEVMPYVTGGVGAAGWEYDLNDRGNPAINVDETAIGFVVGGGIEMMWTEHWILGAEGLYYFFDEDEPLPGIAGDNVEFDDVIVGRVRLGYKF